MHFISIIKSFQGNRKRKIAPSILFYEAKKTLKSIPNKGYRRWENYRYHKLIGREKWTDMSKQRAQILTQA